MPVCSLALPPATRSHPAQPTAGANMGNAWLMRPGSSMIELQPYGFDEGPAHLQYPLFNYEASGGTDHNRTAWCKGWWG